MLRAGSGADAAHAFVGAHDRRRRRVPGPHRRRRRHRRPHGRRRSPPATRCWVRLVRRGNTVSGYTSPDGAAWTRVGFASTSRSANRCWPAWPSAPATRARSSPATFDSVSVNAAPALAAPEAPADLVAAAGNGTRVVLAWRDNVARRGGLRDPAPQDAARPTGCAVGARRRRADGLHRRPPRRVEEVRLPRRRGERRRRCPGRRTRRRRGPASRP